MFFNFYDITRNDLSRTIYNVALYRWIFQLAQMYYNIIILIR